MNQSRLSSFYEACMNIAIGFGVNYTMNFAILQPVLKIDLSHADNFLIGCLFTVVSLVRSYTIRRWFNSRLQAAARRMASTKWQRYGGNGNE